jgi:uncharacterized membrane protein YfcA
MEDNQKEAFGDPDRGFGGRNPTPERRRMRKKNLSLLLIALIVFGAVLFLYAEKWYELIFAIAFVCFVLIYVLSLALKHKEFFFEDWEDGVFRAKPFAKLWTPPIPGVKGRRKMKKGG